MTFDIDWGETQPRRLPVYLLLDCSGSMQGVKIVSVNNGVSTIYEELMRDPRSASTVHISVIYFNDQAYQLDMVPITHFTPPQLFASGTTALGAALHLLNESMESDLIPNTPGRKGDYKPLVFLLTDGQPSDQWESEATRLRERAASGRPLNIIGLAIGDDADIGVIQRIASTTLKMAHVTAENIRAYFDWVSASIRMATQAAGSPTGGLQVAAPEGEGQRVKLSAPPQGIEMQS
jgi:uncharacterized protein YegL